MIDETPEARQEESRGTALYSQYLNDPKRFLRGLTEQAEIAVQVRTRLDFTNEDQKMMYAIAEEMCFSGYWRFSMGLVALVESCATIFLVRKSGASEINAVQPCKPTATFPPNA